MTSAIMPTAALAAGMASRELPATPTLLVNCRFLTRPLSGVDRTASELVRALAERSRSGQLVMECAVPHGAPPDADIRARLETLGTAMLERENS